MAFTFSPISLNLYPPSRKAISYGKDECEDNASADVTKGQAAKHSADNPSEHVEIVKAKAKRISTYLASWGHKGTKGLPVRFHSKGQIE